MTMTQPDEKTLDDLMAQLGPPIASFIRNVAKIAYTRGYLKGQEDGLDSLKAKMDELAAAIAKRPPTAEVKIGGLGGLGGFSVPRGMFGGSVFAPPTQSKSSPDDEVGRTEYGSVRPMLMRYVYENPGKTTQEITAATGLKRNSTRGGLNVLRRRGLMEKRGEGWFSLVDPDATITVDDDT